MPAETTCKTCGFQGNHGFTSGVGGMMHYYHPDGRSRTGRGSPTFCGFWTVERREFKTKADAWRYLRKQYADDAWRRGWDARILEGKERKASRLFNQWQNEQMAERCGA